MQIVRVLRLASCLGILGLLMAGCAPAAAPTPTDQPKTPPKMETPMAKPTVAAPSPTPKPTLEQPRYGGILSVSHPADPISYDPIQESSVQSVSLVVPSYSGIVQIDPLEPTKVIGDLAEKWDVGSDGLTYTFHLYKNVKWHDGTPFTAEDARFTLEVVRKPPRGVTSPRQEWLKAVDRIEAPDKDTLKITLQYPSASFLNNLADGRMVVVPRHVFEAKGNMKRDVMGTGPYKLKSHDAGVSYSVAKNPDYFIKGRPYLDGITWYIIPDVATAFAALRTHRVRMTAWGPTGLRPSQFEILQKQFGDKIVVHRYSNVAFNAFWMPHNKAPWSDIRVRRAVDLAIDRDKVVKVAVEGVGEVGGYMLPGGYWSLAEEELLRTPGYRQPKDADIAEAKRLMAEAGHAGGIKTSTIARNVAEHESAAVTVKEQLAQIGIEVNIRLMDLGAQTDLLLKRTYDTTVKGGSASYDDPDQVFGQQLITGVPRNFSVFSDEKTDKWYDEQSRTVDPAKRKEIVLNMQRRAHELIPFSMMYWLVYQMAHWNEVKSFKAGIGNYNNLKFQDVWLAT